MLKTSLLDYQAITKDVIKQSLCMQQHAQFVCSNMYSLYAVTRTVFMQ